MCVNHGLFFSFQSSATHTNRNDKTAVDLTWQAPGGPSTANITMWCVQISLGLDYDVKPRISLQ